ncbi:MAG: kelch repeat-containing protein [Bacteroidota bacterium]
MSHAYQRIRRGGAALALLLALGANTASAQWTALPSQTTERNWPQTTFLNGKLYVFGGVSSTAYLNSAQSLATGATSWSAVANLPGARYGGYAAAIGGKIYIVGGQSGGGGNAAITYTPSVVVYDPATNTYGTKAMMPIPASMFAGAVVNGKIFVMGGFTGTAAGGTTSAKVQVYDPATDTWGTAPDAPYAAAYATATASGSDIYFIGGSRNPKVATGAYESRASVGSVVGTVIDWKSISDLPVTITRAAGGALDGKVYVAGGANDAGGSNVTYVYDPVAKSWSTSYPMAIATYNVPTMPDDGTSLYFQGGYQSAMGFKYTPGAVTPIVAIGQHDFWLTIKKGTQGTFSLPIGNLGLAPLTGTVEIPANTPWLTTSTPTITPVDPDGSGTIDFTVGGSSIAAGDYKATVAFKTNDRTQPNIPINVHLYVRDEIVSQVTNVVLEECSGAWCGPCGAYGVPLMRQLKEDHPDDLIEIAYHDRNGGGNSADQMATTETEAIGQRLGLPYFPSAGFSRFHFAGQASIMLGTGDWQGALDAVYQNQPIAPVALNLVSYSYDAGGKTVTAKLKLTTSQAIALGNSTLNVTAVAIEDSLQYAQNGNAESPFYHMHVARSFWPNISGQRLDIPADAMDEDGSAILPGKELMVDISFPVSAVTRPKYGRIVFMAHVNMGTTFGPVLQGLEEDLTASISGNGSLAYTITQDKISMTIPMNDTAKFQNTITNNGSAPLVIMPSRLSNNLPSGWQSWFCVSGTNTCTQPTDDNGSAITVAPGASVTVVVKVLGASAGQGKVTMRFADANGKNTDQEFTANVGGASGVDNDAVAGSGLRLSQNTPNPAITSTRFSYYLPTSSEVTAEVFTVGGARVMTLSQPRMEAGAHALDIDVATLPSGVYSVRLVVNGSSVTRMMTVTR